MQRDAYASYEQYETMRRAMNSLQITRDSLESLVEMDRDFLNAGDVLEALELGGDKCIHCLYQGRELYNSIKTKFSMQVSWLGRRQFFELVQLCRFAESFMNRRSFIYKSEAEETIEGLDQFDPSVVVNAEFILDKYPLSAMLPDIMELMDGTHTVCHNYRAFIQNGHGVDEEPLREERMAEESHY